MKNTNSLYEFKKIMTLSVVVVALGYFVDIFDLTLFNMLRIQSLKDIGVPEGDLTNTSIYILNMQMAGMLVGGFLWGILGDKLGRLQTLFGSIILYSLCTLLNAFVTSVDQYAILRFLAGLGLAGELGAGITLVSEILPQKLRGMGTAFVACIGVFGATFSGVMIEYFSWKTCYIIGGALGFGLLFLRYSTKESHLFSEAKKQSDAKIKWGSLSTLMSWPNLSKFILCIFIGIPIWYIAGLVMGFSPELGKDLGIVGEILTSRSIGISYLGLAIGDFASGYLSQKLESRKKALLIFILMCSFLLCILFSFAQGKTDTWFYMMALLIGFAAGFWALFITVAAEQFGTNIRATVATSAPNIVRGATILMTLSFKSLKIHFSVSQSMMIVGVISMVLALAGALLIPETFTKDLNYLEE